MSGTFRRCPCCGGRDEGSIYRCEKRHIFCFNCLTVNPRFIRRDSLCCPKCGTESYARIGEIESGSYSSSANSSSYTNNYGGGSSSSGSSSVGQKIGGSLAGLFFGAIAGFVIGLIVQIGSCTVIAIGTGKESSPEHYSGWHYAPVVILFSLAALGAILGWMIKR
ncbi:MAG: hypothetical protein FD123_416 [Bacteroidetes bacterium]|nr:MAG: hypothetical protein FD123_416 [Bacteroidota bacterium]